MEQYIENYNKPNEKWHITMWVDLPNYSPRGILNFRIKSIVNNLEETISDPNFPNSTYIFRLDNSFINKRAFFHFSFSTKDILTVQSFQFGLCDEGVKWVHVDGLAEVKNESYEFLISRKIQEEIGDKLKLLKEKESSENIDNENINCEIKNDFIDLDVSTLILDNEKTEQISFEEDLSNKIINKEDDSKEAYKSEKKNKKRK